MQSYLNHVHKCNHAIVTGGTRGIGFEISKKLVEKGFFVHATYLRNDVAAKKLLMGYPKNCKTYRIDSTDEVEVKNFIDMLFNEHSNLTTLINNAGISVDNLVSNLKWGDFEKIFRVNFGGPFNYIKSVLPYMQGKKFGNIINISSISSEVVRLGNSLYGSTKAALDRFTKSVCFENARYNIQINTVSPRLVVTDMNRDYVEKNRESILKKTPAKKFVTNTEVAEVVALLASREITVHDNIFKLTGGAHINSD